MSIVQLENQNQNQNPPPARSGLGARLPGWWRQGWFVPLLFIPPLLMLVIINRLVVNVPYWDEWEFTSMVVKLHQGGGFTLNDFWGQHNEHRILFLRLVLLVLAAAGGWSVPLEMYTSWLLQMASALMLGHLLWRTVRSRLLPGLALIVSALVFSGVQAQIGGAAGGFQLVWFMVELAAVTVCWSLAVWPGKWWGLAIAMLSAVVATYSLGGGMLLWPAGLAGLVIQKRLWGLKAIIAWVVAGAFCIWLYFYQYLSYAPKKGSFLDQPWEFVMYVLSYLGAPFAIWGGRELAAVFGGAGLVVFGLALLWLWRNPDKKLVTVVPWLQLALFAGLNAVLTGVGRTVLGADQALSNRYTTIAILFWIALSVVAASALGGVYGRAQQPVRILIVSGSIVLLLACGLGYVNSYNHGYELMKSINNSLEFGLFYLYDYSTAPDPALTTLYPDAKIIRERAWTLDQLKEGPFKISGPQYRQSLQEKWRNQLAPGEFNVQAYPVNLLKPNLVDNASVQLVGKNELTFNKMGSLASHFSFEAGDLAARRGSSILGGWNQLGLDVQAKQAWYALITWVSDKGTPIWSWAYGLDDEGSWKHFRALAPTNVNISSVSIDLFYKNNRIMPERLKIDIYEKK